MLSVVFKVKLNKKGDPETNKHSRMLIATLLDQYQKQNPLCRLVTLLDMTDVGLGNVVGGDNSRYLYTLSSLPDNLFIVNGVCFFSFCFTVTKSNIEDFA